MKSAAPRLLLIEDDPLMARMYQKFFGFEGFIVCHASDGKEGLEKIRAFKPDVVLLDVMMPRMNGLQALEKIKRNLKTKDIPVIMLTNLAGRHQADVALAKGAVRHILKSGHELQEVVHIVREVLADCKQKQSEGKSV